MVACSVASSPAMRFGIRWLCQGCETSATSRRFGCGSCVEVVTGESCLRFILLLLRRELFPVGESRFHRVLKRPVGCSISLLAKSDCSLFLISALVSGLRYIRSPLPWGWLMYWLSLSAAGLWGSSRITHQSHDVITKATAATAANPIGFAAGD